MSSGPQLTLGKYQIIREIARSNDIVYEAYDPLMNRRVALKELSMPAGMSTQQKQDRINRFNREAQAAGTLSHPNIMTVYELGLEGDRHFMALEYLDGHTLRNELDTKGFLPVDKAVEVAVEVLQGLEHAHSKGVIHRDIKPDNIQILSSGEIKITDFGIARLTFQPNLTMDGQVFGTPSYMSPEQVVGKEIDARSDLFSVGVMLYEMIGGQKPFAGDSVVTITYAIVNKEPERLQQVNFALWQVISRTLDKSPSLRPASASELIHLLQDALHASADPVLPAMTPRSQTTIYGQAAPPPMGNPYTTPYPGSQAPAPPVIYPYNPYNPQQQPSQQSLMSQPGHVPVPVYYPPAPRQPLVKPETKQFLGNLFVSLMVLGTLAAVVLITISSASTAVSNKKRQERDEQVIQGSGINTNLPPEQQIAEYEKLKEQLTSADIRTEIDVKIAVLYERIGKAQEKGGQMVEAEASYKSARTRDPSNAKYDSDLAHLYDNLGHAQSDAYQKAQYFLDAGLCWETATNNEPNRTTKATYARAAATSFYNAAVVMYEQGEGFRTQARQALYNARKHVVEGDDLSVKIEQMLDLLTR